MGGRAVRVAAVVLAGALLVLGGVGRSWAFRAVKEGSPAPALSLPSVGGDTVNLASFKGKSVVVAFVRQGQGKSLEAVKALTEVAGTFGDRVAVVAVLVNPDAGDPAAWAREAQVSFPVLLDADRTAYARYGVVVVPSTGVLDPEGGLVGEVGGYTHGYRDAVDRLVRTALGEQVAETAEVAASGPAKSPERKAAERQLQKARLLVKRRMADKAVSAARAAVEADDTYAEAHALLGSLLLEESDGNADEAATHFHRALELDPKSTEAKVGLARVRSILGDYDGAVAELEKAVRLTPRPERLYYELGRIHERAGRYERAVEAYRKALERLLR